jgi:hypothetical protein
VSNNAWLFIEFKVSVAGKREDMTLFTWKDIRKLSD